ncbi:MAG: hypothetical protein Fur0032_24910 [Terrimicrobiaceae bacterium]
MIRLFPILALVACALPAFAGQLDVAVLQFSGPVDRDALAASLSGVQLAEVADANKIRSKDPILQSAGILFAQSIPAVRGQKFASITRMGPAKADVRGSLGGGALDVEITLSEGAQTGISSFQRRNYRGSGSLPSGPASIIAIRESKGKSPYVVRSASTVQHYSYSLVVVAQYTP